MRTINQLQAYIAANSANSSCPQAGASEDERGTRLRQENRTASVACRCHKDMEPEQDIKTAEWKYRVEGTAAGHSIAAVFKFREINQAIVITVFEVN